MWNSQAHLKCFVILKTIIYELFKISNCKVRIQNVTNLLIWTVARKPVSLTIETKKCEALQICEFGR